MQTRGSPRYGQLIFNGGEHMNIEDFQLPEEQAKELEEKHKELIENQPEHEPNDGCDGGGCVI